MIAFLRRSIPVVALVLLPQLTPAAPVDTGAVPGDVIAPRGAVVVTGSVLHLGDLFTNVGDKAGVRVGNTPPAGTPLTIDAPSLQRIAAAHGLSWRPASTQDRTVVERDSVAIPTEDITNGVLMALMQKGVATDGLVVELTLGSRRYYRPREGQMQVDAVTVDPSGLRFGAILAIVTAGEARQTVAVTGRLQRTVALPVLLRPVRSGEVINEDTVGWAQLPDRQVSTSAVRDRQTLVGQSARRALPAGAPILVSDLQPVMAVNKGQAVTLFLTLPGMRLSASGIALEAGAAGDVIHVLNERSKAKVQGVVNDDGTVDVVATPVAR